MSATDWSKVDNVGKLGNVLALTHCTEAAAAGLARGRETAQLSISDLCVGYDMNKILEYVSNYIMNVKDNESKSRSRLKIFVATLWFVLHNCGLWLEQTGAARAESDSAVTVEW